MDDPAIDPAEHRRALAGLARLNQFGDSVGALWEEIGPMAKMPSHAGLNVLDIATGSGDVPVALARLARKAAATLSLAACDVSPTALAAAGKRAEQYGISLATFQLDAIRQEIPGEYDIVMCSLFTHHLEEDQVVDLLYRMKAAARRMVLVNDLVRTSGSYRLAVAGAHLLSRSRIVHVDAAKSMRAAFTVQEFEELAEEAGLSGARVERRRPCRFLLSWRRER
jgi:2-polyprenyl-3-methyl-5-hydroxy-6-metoxy-1,4-benzoquinol methylase